MVARYDGLMAPFQQKRLYVLLAALISIFLLVRNLSWTSERAQIQPSTPVRKELVVASLKAENTSWLGQYLPDWTANVYIVDDSVAKLTVPKNKGREAMVYLT